MPVCPDWARRKKPSSRNLAREAAIRFLRSWPEVRSLNAQNWKMLWLSCMKGYSASRR